MKFYKPLVCGIALLLFLSLACTIGGQSVEELETFEERAVATSVAATLAAGVSLPEVTSEAPTETSAPTPASIPVLRVAYLLEGNIWLWTEDIGAVQLTHAGQVTDLVISDDGLMMAFEREINYSEYELWAVNSDGSNERRLLSVADFTAMPRMNGAIGTAAFQIDWVPETHIVAFNTRPLFEGPGLISDNNLRLMDADTLERTLLLPNGQGGMFYYSPNGAQIAIVTPEGISLVNTDGGNRREMITYPNIYTYSEYAYYPEPLWLPDSSGFLAAIPPQDPLGDPGTPTALWRFPADGSAAVLLQNVVTEPFFISPVTFSPDGDQVAFLVRVGDEMSDRRDLQIMTLSGHGGGVYASGTLWFSGWALDSTHFVYALDSPNNLQLGQLEAAPRALTDTALAVDVRWVSGNDILFKAGGAGNWEIRRGVPGGASSQVAYLGDEFPVFDFDY